MFLHGLNINELHDTQLILSEFNSYSGALSTLKEGYLSRYYVKPQTLSEILDTISSSFNDNFPLYRLIHNEPDTYYDLLNALFATTNNHLFIHLQIPLQHIDLYLFPSILTKNPTLK